MADSTTKIILTAFDKTKSAFDSANKNIEDISGAVVKLSGAMAGISVGALATAIKISTDTADAASKNAQKVGMLTEEWTRLEYAAGMSDVTTEKLTAGLSNLSIKAFEAATSGGASAEMFTRLGISATDSSGKVRSSGELFADITNKLSKMEDGSTKTALAAEFFGKKVASDLIPMINGGTAGLSDMADEADRLGVTITGQTGLAAEQFNDNLTRMAKAGEGAANTLTAALLPTLNVIAEAIIGTANDSGVLALATDGAKVALQTISIVGANVAYVFKQVGNEIGGTAAQLMAVATGDFSGAARIGDIMREDAKIAREELDALEKRIMNPPAPPAAAERRAAAPVYDSTEKVKALQKESDAIEKHNKRLVEKYIDWDNKEYERQQKQHDKLAADNQEYFARLSNDAFEVAATDEEIIQRRHDEELSALETRRMIAATDHELTLAELEQFEQAKADIFFKYESGRQEVNKTFHVSQQNFDKMSLGQQTRVISDGMGNMLAMAGTKYRAFFEINKAYRTADAVVTGIAAVQDAYKFGTSWGGPIGGAAMAAIAVAATAANVAAIQGASFGGGTGMGGAGGGSGGVPMTTASPLAPQTVQPVTPVGTVAQAQSVTNVTIVGNSSSTFTYDQMVNEFIPMFNEAADRGAKINVVMG